MIERRMAGMALMVIGGVLACYWGIYRPSNFLGQLASYVFCLVVFGGGVWLWMKKRSR